jgi:hypothetical protein
LTAAAHRDLIAQIAAQLPPDTAIMAIGGGSMLESGIRRVLTTKDEDVVLLLVEGRQPRVAEVETVVALIRSLGAAPSVHKDQTSVGCVLSAPHGRYLVEFIRGRKAGGGYFVSRALLERVAAMSAVDGRVLAPPLEALAFLKAWAAVDKAKLVRAGKDDRGYHASRERAFRDDVASILSRILERRQVDAGRVDGLLSCCGRDRARAVRAVLDDAGWPK